MKEAEEIEGDVLRDACLEWQEVKESLDAVVSETIAEQETLLLRAELHQAHQQTKILIETVQHLSKENDELRERLQTHSNSFAVPNIADEIPVAKTCSVADPGEKFLTEVCNILEIADKYQMKSEKLCHMLRHRNIQLWDAALDGRSFKSFVKLHQNRLLWRHNIVLLRETKCWHASSGSSCPYGDDCKFAH